MSPSSSSSYTCHMLPAAEKPGSPSIRLGMTADGISYQMSCLSPDHTTNSSHKRKCITTGLIILGKPLIYQKGQMPSVVKRV